MVEQLRHRKEINGLSLTSKKVVSNRRCANEKMDSTRKRCIGFIGMRQQ